MSETYKILDRIKKPSDIKTLGRNELQDLSDELRLFIIESISKTGGHLAAGLGAVDLTVALHFVYNTPEDILVWDIGHQCYPHKILTGRKEQMLSLRKKRWAIGIFKKR